MKRFFIRTYGTYTKVKMDFTMEITAESIQDQIPYYLSQEAKDNLVKALKRFPDNINYYINLYQSDMLQGDGWTSLELIRFEDGERKKARRHHIV